MSEQNKITQEELDKLVAIVGPAQETEQNFIKVAFQLAELKNASNQLYNQLQQYNANLQSEMQALKEIYGDVRIDLKTGEFEAVESQEETPELTVVE
jgi:hypothetical protein